MCNLEFHGSNSCYIAMCRTITIFPNQYTRTSISINKVFNEGLSWAYLFLAFNRTHRHLIHCNGKLGHSQLIYYKEESVVIVRGNCIHKTACYFFLPLLTSNGFYLVWKQYCYKDLLTTCTMSINCMYVFVILFVTRSWKTGPNHTPCRLPPLEYTNSLCISHYQRFTGLVFLGLVSLPDRWPWVFAWVVIKIKWL